MSVGVSLGLLVVFSSVETRQSASGAWTSIGPGGGGWIMSIAASPHGEQDVWAGGDIQGMFHSSTGGRRWNIQNQGLHDFWLEAILFHPLDPGVIYVGGTSGVYKTADRGETWTWLRNGFPPVARFSWSAPVSALAMDPANPDVIYAGIGTPRSGAGKQGAVYKTSDGGGSWTKINAAGSLPADALIVSLVARPSTATPAPGTSTTPTLYAASQYGFFISRDGGVTWAASNTGLPHTNVARIAVSPSSPDVLYLTLYTPTALPWRGGVYRSTDGGRTWAARNTGLHQQVGAADTLTSNYRELVVDPTDPLVAYVGTSDYVSPTLYKTTDGGARWTVIVAKPQASAALEGWGAEAIGHTTECLAISPVNPRVLYFGTSVAVFRTENAGETWTQAYTQPNADGSTQTTGLETTVSRFVMVDPGDSQRVFFGYTDIGLFVSLDGGATFRRRVGGLPRATANSAYAVAADPRDRAHLWGAFGPHDTASSGFLVAESTDSGATWTARSSGLPDTLYKRLLVDNSSAPRLLVTVRGVGIYVSDNGGASWRPSSGEFAHGDVRDLVADPSRPGRYWAVIAGRGSDPGIVYRSDDRGTTWQRVSDASLGVWDIKHLAVSGTLYLAVRQGDAAPATYPGGLFASEDGGVTWSRVLADPFAEAVAVDPADSRVVYAGLTDHPYHDDSPGNGLKVSRDGGTTWSDVPMPTGRISALAPHPGDSTRIFVGTNGVGVGVIDFRSTASRRRPRL